MKMLNKISNNPACCFVLFWMVLAFCFSTNTLASEQWWNNIGVKWQSHGQKYYLSSDQRF